MQEKETALQKLAAFWNKHRRLLISIAVVLVVGYVFVMWLQNRSKDTLLAGIGVNIPLSEAGTACLSSDFKAHLGSDSQWEEVHFAYMELENADGAALDSYYGLKSLQALCQEKQLDYLLLDQESFELLLSHGLYRELSEVYSQQELDAMEEMLVYCQLGEDAEPVPTALRITQCPFVQAHTEVSGPVYFVYTMDSPRTQAARELLSYLLAWQPQT